MGGRGSGGHNKLSVAEHVSRGTFRPDRHTVITPPKVQAIDGAVSAADRRRVLAGLGPVGRRLVQRLLADLEGWDAPTLALLHSYGRSADRVALLEEGGPSPDLSRELRVHLELYKRLKLDED